jgi:hypothetical protein
MVILTDAIVKPRAMMIVNINTLVTNDTMI